MKSSWIGMGFSHHSVPSLSNTATRSSTGTATDPSSPHVRRTKSQIARLVGVSRHLESNPSVTAVLYRPVVMAASSFSRTWSTVKLAAFCRGGNSWNVARNCAISACAAMHR